MRPRPCEICHNPQADFIYRREFTPLPGSLLSGYEVVACPACGFCFARDLPTAEEFDRYYEEQSKYEYHQRDGAPSEYDSRRLPAAAAIIAEWLPDRSARILDIGCANGGLLAALKAIGYSNLLGLDPSPTCAAAAQRLHGIEVVTGPLSRLTPAMGQFDLIIFGSVLEHLLELNGMVARIEPHLTAAGCVYVEVPDMTRCTRLVDAPFQEFSVEHINFFSPVSLSNLWRKHGFSVRGLRQFSIPYLRGNLVYEVKAMFQRGAHAAATPEFDAEAGPEIRRYVERSAARLAHLTGVIDRLADSGEPILVWGAGTHTQGLLSTTRLGEANIRAVVDSNARYRGQTLGGVTICGPDEIAGRPEAILISSQQFQEEIVHEIAAVRGLSNRLITLY